MNQEGKPQTSPELAEKAQEALAAKEGFHFTQHGTDVAREKHREAMRAVEIAHSLDTGADAHVYSIGTDAARKGSDELFEQQAAIRNDQRSGLEKVRAALGLGPRKLTGADMLREEAERMNQLVDERVARDGAPYQAAADEIGESEEFKARYHAPTLHKDAGSGGWKEGVTFGYDEDAGRMHAKEELRAADAAIEAGIERGSLSAAMAHLDEMRESGESTTDFYIAMTNMVGMKVDTMIRAKDTDSLRKLFSDPDINAVHVSARVLSELPQEVLADPEVREQAEARMRTWYMSAEEKQQIRTAFEKSAGSVGA